MKHAFGDRASKGVTKVSEVIRIGPLQYDWYPYIRRGNLQRHIEREDHIRIQRKDSHLQAKVRGHRGKPSYHSSIWAFNLQNHEEIGFWV